MKKIFSVVTSIFMLFSISAYGDDHRSSASNSAVAEFWMCQLNEGQTMDDVRQLTKIVEKYTESIEGKAGQLILTPFSGDMTPGTFALMTVWPNFEEMGKGFQGWFAEGAGDKGMVIFNRAASCSTRNFATIEEQFNMMD
jgi:hypothetical protein